MKYAALLCVAAATMLPTSIYAQGMPGGATVETPSAPVLAPGTTQVLGNPGGRGFPVGEKSRIHTNLDVDVGFDSNPARSTPGTGQGAGFIDFRPGINVNAPGTDVAFGMDASLGVEEYFQTLQQGLNQTEVGANVGARFQAGSGDSPVAFKLRDSLTRTPTYLPSEPGSVGSEELLYKLWYNTGEADLLFRPGGGAVEITAGYTNQVWAYDTLPSSQLHGVLLEGKLKFLPKTAAVIDLNGGFYSTASAAGVQTEKATPYSVVVGLQGQVTSRLATVLRVGYADMLSTTGDFFGPGAPTSQRTIVARAGLTYYVTENSDLMIAYDRHLLPVLYLNSYTGDTLEARARIQLYGKLGLSGYVGAEFRHFAGSDTASSGSAAQVYTGDVRVEYWFFDFLNLALGYQVVAQSTNVATVGAVNPFLTDYTRHLALIDVGLHY